MGKTVRGAKREHFKKRKRRTDKREAYVDRELDSDRLMRNLKRDQRVRRRK